MNQTEETVSRLQLTTPQSEIISFQVRGETVMKLDKDGMEYKGQRIEDAGEAHALFLKTLMAMGDPT